MGRDTDYERQSEARRIGAMGPEAAEDVCALPGACYCGDRTFVCDGCERTVPWCRGFQRDHAVLCDDCAAEG